MKKLDPYKPKLRIGSQWSRGGRVDAQNGALEGLKKPVFADLHNFDDEKDPDSHLSDEDPQLWI